jgi:hypothetical protein
VLKKPWVKELIPLVCVVGRRSVSIGSAVGRRFNAYAFLILIDHPPQNEVVIVCSGEAPTAESGLFQ